MTSFRSLSLPSKLEVVLLYTRINLKIVFGLKALLLLAGTLLYVVVLCLLAVYTEVLSLSVGQALPLVIWLPLTLFAVIFSMDIISRERDANLIETFFTVSGSVYRLWIIKFATLMGSLSFLAFALILTTDLFVVEVPIWLTLLSVLPPILFFASLTVLLSALTGSANAAGLCVTAILAFVVITSEGLATTVVYPYLNPFEKPVHVESFIWNRNVVYNKIAFFLLGCVCFWRALRRLDHREKLLK